MAIHHVKSNLNAFFVVFVQTVKDMDLSAHDFKPKNVSEELKSFLQANPHDWFTNEQLAEHLNQYRTNLSSTASGIRNAVTKLKSTNLVKTKMDGTLAYRGWHTASYDDFYHTQNDLDAHKKIPGRSCNGCGTCYSRYWRSDLEEKNGWLCNNCGY